VTLVAKGNNTFQAIYLNGSNVASQNSGNAPTSTLTGYDIGAWPGFYYNGNIDEFRISNTVLSAAWIATEYNNQNSPSSFYSIGSSQPYSAGGPAQVIAPIFSVAPGSYSSTQSVSLSTTTSGATIRYTLDGTNPTESLGLVYSGAITVSNSTVIKAIAYASGMTDSQITTAAYVIGSTVAPGPHLGIGYDVMGRPQTETDLATNTAIISGATYGPASQLLSITGLINETRGYNSLNQLTSLISSNASGTAVNLTYAYSSTQNNGKITSMTDNISGEQVVYTYDTLNRLASAAATNGSWGQSYAYDGFGNLTDQTVTAGSAPAYHVVYNAATNRQTTDCADANGNINSSAGGCGATSYNYDVANRIVSVASSSPSWQYSYAPHNRRVWRGVWTGSTLTTDEVTFWGASGAKLGTWALSVSGSQLVATMSSSNYYFAGRMIKNNVGYDAADQLGSLGKLYPYGQEKPAATANGTEKFTGYLRDSETGNDYAINRYHAPGQGRFLSSDPSRASARVANPNSWNRYVYALGDPLNGKDPSGLLTDANAVPPSTTVEIVSTLTMIYAPFGNDGSFDSTFVTLFAIAMGDLDAVFTKLQNHLQLNLTQQRQAADAFTSLNHNCQQAITDHNIDLTAVAANAANVTYWFGGGDEGNTTIQSITGYVDPQNPGITLAQDGAGGNVDAEVLEDANGNCCSNNIVLYQGYFDMNAQDQNLTLIHENLHAALDLNDRGLAARLGLGAFPDTSFGNTTASQAISNWLSRDCTYIP
jgi:RHS repeat-associated protein